MYERLDRDENAHEREGSPHDESNDFFADAVVPLHGQRKSTSPIPVIPELAISLGLLILIFGSSYIGHSNMRVAPEKNVHVEDEIEIKEHVAESILAYRVFDSVALEAKGAIVWDVREQKVLFNKNADDVLPLASITKLMTALVAYELIDSDERIQISLHDIQTDGDSGLAVGEIFTLEDLADITLLASSNDGASALGATVAKKIESELDHEKAFTVAMNLRAKDLGLARMHFSNSTGLDVSPTEAGAYGTAREVTLLMEHIILNTPNAVALTVREDARVYDLSGNYHNAQNTNEIVQEIDGLIASKTGSTELAGGNLVIAFNVGLDHPIIISVLGSTYEGRFNDMLTLVEKTKLYLASK